MKKAGFKKVSIDKRENIINDFLLPKYLDEYGDGDYGFEETEVLIKNEL